MVVVGRYVQAFDAAATMLSRSVLGRVQHTTELDDCQQGNEHTNHAYS